jgi:broad specificity phosphatase PhoE
MQAVDTYLADAPVADRAVYSWPDIVGRLEKIDRGEFHHRTLIYRHAQTEYNAANLITGQRNVDLTGLGRDAARQLRNLLPERFDAVYCSALKRAIDTADLALRQQPGRPVIVDARFNEVGLGTLEGQRRRYISAFAMGDIDFAPPAGESYRTAAQRIFSAFIDLCERALDRHCASTDLVFAHAGVMRILATLVIRMDNPTMMFALRFHKERRLEIENHMIRVPSFWYLR